MTNEHFNIAIIYSFKAAISNNLDIVKILIKFGANVNRHDASNKTASDLSEEFILLIILFLFIYISVL